MKTAVEVAAVADQVVGLLNLVTYESIPLGKLVLWDGNVRKTYEESAVVSIAASIKAVGLIHPLIVLKQPKTKYGVVAGGMRYRALKLLEANGDVDGQFEVWCAVMPAQTAEMASEISLAENVERYAMDPIDEALAFANEVKKGRSMAEIAVRFGQPERFVRQRLKLADVHGSFIKLYRAGKLTLEVLQAFTLADSTTQQREVWKNIPEHWRDRGGPELARQIRHALREETVDGNDKRVRFVGLPWYRDSGGRVQDDLFTTLRDESDDYAGMFLLDVPLLDRLAREKLKAESAGLVQGFAAVVQDFDRPLYQVTSELTRVHPETILPPKLAAKQAKLEQAYEAIAGDESDDENRTPAEMAKLEKIQTELHQIEQQTEQHFSPEQRAKATAFVYIDQHGKLQLEAYAPRGATASSGSSDRSPAVRGPFSRPLVQTLTTHKTAAIAAELAVKPDIALASVLYSFIAKNNSNHHHVNFGVSACEISCAPVDYREIEEEDGDLALTWLYEQYTEWVAKMPKQPSALWAWCVGLSEADKMGLLAVLVARSLNAVDASGWASAKQRLWHADAIATSLGGVEMAKWFRPTRKNFFNRVSRAQILDFAKEAGVVVTPETAAMKKAALAEWAEHNVGGLTKWVPKPASINDGPDDPPEFDDPEEFEGDEEEEGTDGAATLINHMKLNGSDITINKRELRMMLGAAAKQLLSDIDRLEIEVIRSQAFSTERLPRFPGDDETRLDRLTKAQQYLAEQRVAYASVLELQRQENDLDSEQFGRDVAAYVAAKKPRPIDRKRRPQ